LNVITRKTSAGRAEDKENNSRTIATSFTSLNLQTEMAPGRSGKLRDLNPAALSRRESFSRNSRATVKTEISSARRLIPRKL
jgi:hypothetical protein